MDISIERIAHCVPVRLRETFCSVTQLLISNADNIGMEELWLFGSVARGEANILSDLDFLVVPTVSDERKRVSLAVEFLDVRDDYSDTKVDVVVRTKEYLEDTTQLFVREFLRDRIALWRRGD